MSDAPNTGRADYDAMFRFRQLAPGEPSFLIRGRDQLSGPAARAWAALAQAAGVSPAVVESALQQADALDAWADKHLPDVSHLTKDEVLQLTFKLERRAWEARSDSADPRLMLAEERALQQAMGRLRPVLATLFAGLVQEDDGSWRYTPPTHEGRPVRAACPIEALRRLSVVLRAGASAEAAVA